MRSLPCASSEYWRKQPLVMNTSHLQASSAWRRYCLLLSFLGMRNVVPRSNSSSDISTTLLMCVRNRSNMTEDGMWMNTVWLNECQRRMNRRFLINDRPSTQTYGILQRYSIPSRCEDESILSDNCSHPFLNREFAFFIGVHFRL